MKTIFCFCLSLLLVLNISEAQIIGNTLNACYYAKNYNANGAMLIASIQISGTVDNNLSQCCEKCRAFPNCIVWDYLSNVCYFYSSFTNFTATTTERYVGKNSGSAFWSCNEEPSKYYFESSLNWSRQTVATSTFNRAGCCQDCFWAKGTVTGCKSYMYNEISRDCYHTNLNFTGSLSINYDGVFSGTPLWNLN